MLSVILPCYNEEANVSLWESDLFPALDRLTIPVELLVVDDGSTDGTAAAVENLSKRRPSVRLLRHERNRGLGAAVRTGLAGATGDAVATLDSDLTFSPSLLSPMIDALKAGADCVCASPVLGEFEGVTPLRRFLSLGVNLVYRVLLGRPLTAVSSLCRLYRANVIRRMALVSEFFDINAEIIFRLLECGASIVEVPATLSTRRFGVSKIRFSREIKNHLRMFWRILLWRLR